jgi:hypothetical protein
MAEHATANPGGKPEPATPQGSMKPSGLPGPKTPQLASEPVGGAVTPGENQLSVSAIPNVNARLSGALKALLPERHVLPGGFASGISANGGKPVSGGGV